MLWSVDQTPYGRSCKHPMVGRPQTLWSVDQATFEWNGPKTESSVNDFLHKRAKMCNSDFLDCKLKSQKFNYRFDSISWFYATLWYQKNRRENRLPSWYMIIPCCFTGHGPVPVPALWRTALNFVESRLHSASPSSQSHGQPWSLSLSSRHEAAMMAE